MTRAHFNKKFPKWLKSRREELGLTQAQLAGKVGLSQFWVSHYECGRRVPDSFIFYTLQKFLGAF